jgi:hypothetical protein
MAITLDGTLGLTLPGAATGVQVGSLTSGTAQATTSGTSIDFTDIPDWVKRITVMFNGVSGSGTGALVCRVGTSSGVISTGYFSVYEGIGTGGTTSSLASNTTFFGLMGGLAATDLSYGSIMLTTVGSNIWVISGTVCRDAATDAVYMTSGAVTLSGTLDRVRLTWSNGTDTFDAGSVNILYE